MHMRVPMQSEDSTVLLAVELVVILIHRDLEVFNIISVILLKLLFLSNTIHNPFLLNCNSWNFLRPLIRNIEVPNAEWLKYHFNYFL
jgi:hypothetical protein